ncbi:E3 ubiquitin-protein ligase DZIP3-like, partial [Exaiptasia diaphana]|uniref:DZIP3-like HEPN domain-containing protein n=1 Tax=Exaiptasia diaphana TaxID=2652724 RepID=A0A913YGI5_EXADI
MATSAPLPPPPLGTTTSTSKQRSNYTRIGRLLTDIGTRVLRGVLDSHHPPASLQKHINSPAVNSTLKKLRAKRVLNTQQWSKLYPPAPGVPSSTTFDITLLFLLLRNTCGLTPPTTGWDAAPPPADVSKEADLIRVKRCRNEITGHSTAAELSDADFETHWAEIEAAMIRLGG